jgi:hypothetical protein
VLSLKYLFEANQSCLEQDSTASLTAPPIVPVSAAATMNQGSGQGVLGTGGGPSAGALMPSRLRSFAPATAGRT